MFREMRRKHQQISQAECEEMLLRASTGVLGVMGDEGYPYTVPLNFVYEPGKDGAPGTIGFHCAREGHKIDAIRRCEKVSFCVVDRDEVAAKERTTKFASVIAFGRARILEDKEEMRRSALALGRKYAADYEQDCIDETEETLRTGRLCCVEITVEHLTGKIGRLLLVERQKEART